MKTGNHRILKHPITSQQKVTITFDGKKYGGYLAILPNKLFRDLQIAIIMMPFLTMKKGKFIKLSRGIDL